MFITEALIIGISECVSAADNGDGSYRLDFANGSQRLATAQEISIATSNIDNYVRERVVSDLSSSISHVKLLRAVLLVCMDEFNAHASKINEILTAIDNGSTLAQVKTNIAAIADYPTRTKAQLIAAMTNKINAGDADT